jgi:hypothetical protein
MVSRRDILIAHLQVCAPTVRPPYANALTPSFVPVIPERGLPPANPESITTNRVMDCALAASRRPA